MSEFIKIQQEARKSAYEQAKALLDNAASEKRDLSGEETQTYERIMADLDERAKLIESIKATADREERAAEAAASFKPSESTRSNDSDILRAIARGEQRGFEFAPNAEQRTLVGSSNTVPASFYNQVFQVARLVGPMLTTSQIFNTTSGENLTIPTLTARSTAAVATATAAIAASDPTFSSITLGAYKYSFLVGVANELIADAGFDLTSLIAEQAGNEIGFRVNNDLTLGTGTVQPNGLATVAGSAVTGSTAVSGAFTYDNLVDLVYNIDGSARQLPGVGFQMSTSSLGVLRKLKDGAGNYIFVPGTTGAPDTVLGFPVYENPAVAAVAVGAKSVLFGHLPSYKVRIAGGIDIAQSPDYAFNQDVTTFRVKMRVDGNLTHASHIKYFKGGAS
jgi:HK97 family phage major capsid protein